MDVWEEDIKREESAWEFQVVTVKKWREVKNLIDDFPNFKVGTLLPDPTVKPERVVVQVTLEWTVVTGGRWFARTLHSTNHHLRGIGLVFLVAEQFAR